MPCGLNDSLRIAPSGSAGTRPKPMCTRAYFWPSGPPNTAVWPLSLPSVADSTQVRAFRQARMKALSSSGPSSLGSVNWASNTISFAPSLRRRSTTRACAARGNGQRSCMSWKLASSMASTTTSGGGFCLPRMWKRASIDLRSRSAVDFV
jgi:hypothetical protein